MFIETAIIQFLSWKINRPLLVSDAELRYKLGGDEEIDRFRKFYFPFFSPFFSPFF